MKSVKNSYPPLIEPNILLKLISMIMLLVVLFQPASFLVLETLDSNQEMTLVDNDLNDSQEDDSQEEEKEEYLEEFNFEVLTCELIFLSKSPNLILNPIHWSEYEPSIVIPPPEFT